MGHQISEIKAVVFDLGGVVIDLQRQAAVDALSELGVPGVDKLLGEYEQNGPFRDLETGRLTAAAFFDYLRSLAKGNGSAAPEDIALQTAFNAFLVGLPVERLHRIQEVRQAGYAAYVLSNTNPVMFNSWIAEAFAQDGLRINDYFDGVVTSFQEGMCKPDPALFKRVLTRYGLTPASTLMLDDSAANCEAARSVGMQALQIGATPDTDMLHATSLLLKK